MYGAMKHSSAIWLQRNKQNPRRKPLVAVGNSRTVFKRQFNSPKEDLKGIYARFQIQPISQILLILQMHSQNAKFLANYLLEFNGLATARKLDVRAFKRYNIYLTNWLCFYVLVRISIRIKDYAVLTHPVIVQQQYKFHNKFQVSRKRHIQQIGRYNDAFG